MFVRLPEDMRKAVRLTTGIDALVRGISRERLSADREPIDTASQAERSGNGPEAGKRNKDKEKMR